MRFNFGELSFSLMCSYFKASGTFFFILKERIFLMNTVGFLNFFEDTEVFQRRAVIFKTFSLLTFICTFPANIWFTSLSLRFLKIQAMEARPWFLCICTGLAARVACYSERPLNATTKRTSLSSATTHTIRSNTSQSLNKKRKQHFSETDISLLPFSVWGMWNRLLDKHPCPYSLSMSCSSLWVPSLEPPTFYSPHRWPPPVHSNGHCHLCSYSLSLIFKWSSQRRAADNCAQFAVCTRPLHTCSPLQRAVGVYFLQMQGQMPTPTYTYLYPTEKLAI